MGWYTRGPGDLEFKYGDVAAAARDSGVGILGVAPLVRSDTDDVEALELVRDLQAAVGADGLPWAHLEFSTEVDRGGAFVGVPLDCDPMAMVAGFGELLADHIVSVRRVVTSKRGSPATFATLTVSVDLYWVVAPHELSALLDWLNAPLEPGEAVTMELLREGRLEHGWYQPPATLEAAFAAFADEDLRNRSLVAHGLAHLALSENDDSQGKLWLAQPDDDYWKVAWQAVDAVLFRPVDHPFMNRLAQAFGVSEDVRGHHFFVCAAPSVPLPPEAETPPQDLAAGSRFGSYAGSMIAAYLGNRMAPDAEHGVELQLGWHNGGSFDELSAVFTAAGKLVESLDQVLAEQRTRWRRRSVPGRLKLWAEQEPDLVAYLLDGTGPCPTATLAHTAVLMAMLDRFDLVSAPILERLEHYLRTAVR